ncbi:hypothetical protein ES702_05959 [subsurface metagenome]
MRKFKVLVLALALFSLCGCATLSGLYELGIEGYKSDEGQQAGQAAQVIATPLVGQPLATAIAVIVSSVLGGVAVWKRQKYLDTPVKKS